MAPTIHEHIDSLLNRVHELEQKLVNSSEERINELASKLEAEKESLHNRLDSLTDTIENGDFIIPLRERLEEVESQTKEIANAIGLGLEGAFGSDEKEPDIAATNNFHTNLETEHDTKVVIEKV